MKNIILSGLVMVSAVGVVMAAEESKPAAPVAPWNTTVGAGVNLSRGNTKSMLLNGSVVSEFKKDKNEAKVGVEGNYGETEVTLADKTKETQGNVENSRAFADYRRLLNERTYGYLSGEVRNDNIAKIDYRAMVGPGIGQYLLKSDRQNLAVEIGATYIMESVDGVKDEKPALRLGERYDLKVGDASKIWESVEFLPAFQDFGDYLMNAEVGAEAAMNTRLSLRLVLQDKYDSTPGAGLKKNDLVVIGGLVYKL